MRALTPKQIVCELDRFIVGQHDAKKAVAVALRNRWRRLQLDRILRDEIVPKNILMIGPTGVGKTEIARRLARLDDAPFIKIEATKFTEVGYVGRDVDQIIRDLIEISVQIVKEKSKMSVQEKAYQQAQERILDILVGEGATATTREKFRLKLANGDFNDNDIEIQIQDNSSAQAFEIPGMSNAHMVNLGDVFGKTFGTKTKTRQTIVKEALEIFQSEEAEKLIDQDKIVSSAIELAQEKGIVFLDEIDKICTKDGRSSDVSREGVQRDLLPLIEGTIVSTKYGQVKTDHILFIASGAFHLSSPSDLLPELQGRLPIRVELKPLTRNDFVRILQEPESNLIKQYQALLSVEGVSLIFSQESIEEIALLAETLNQTVENIGARRLHTILEKLLEEINFNADSCDQKEIHVTREDVKSRISDLAHNIDLSKFIL